MVLISRTFDQLIDFTRTTAGTYVDSNGLIQNTPASRNLLTFTQEFDNAAWSKVATTVTANSTVAPDGTLTADAVTEDTANNQHRVNATYTFSSTATHVFSVYVKANGRDFCRVNNGTDGIVVLVNLTTGAVISVTNGASAIVTDAGGGWWRIALTFAPATAAAKAMAVNISKDGVTSGAYVGDGTSGIYVWGAQLELGSTATDYTRNNGGRFPARFDYDPVTMAPRGLLVEEQRTNLLLRSEEFDNASWSKTGVTVTANSAASPAGTATADTLAASSANGTVVQSVSTTAVAMTFSIYLKRKTGTGNIQISADGSTWVTQAIDSTNWTRCIVTQTAVAGTTSPGLRIVTSGDEVYGWGAQYE